MTAIDNVVIPRVEMAVRSVTESSGRRPIGMVQNSDQRNCTGTTVNTPLMLALNRVDLNIDQNKNDDTRTVENFEGGDILALGPKYDRIAHTHHRFFSAFLILNFMNVFSDFPTYICIW